MPGLETHKAFNQLPEVTLNKWFSAETGSRYKTHLIESPQ